MPIVYLLLLYFLLGGACLYLVFCADPHGKGPISLIRRLVFDKFPVAFKYSSATTQILILLLENTAR